jgi:ATP-dependent RNA helicase RhlB
MLFSATLNAWVKNLAWEYTKSPFEIEIAPETVTVDEVEQVLYHVISTDKMKMLLGILEREKPESAIIFCNTKRYTEIVAKRLRANGYNCEFIIGDLPQVKRQRIIDDLKAGRVKFLVATDVAARGLDIEGLSLVVNYDLPVEAENYVHRIGRTARAGKTGRAITLASEQDVYELPDIEKYIGKKLPAEIAGADLYGEDKSAGMRIQTDFYEDRGGGRRDGRSDRGHRGDDRYRSERPRAEHPRGEHPRSEHPRGEGGRDNRRRGDGRRPEGRVRDNRGPGGVQGQRPAVPPSPKGPGPGASRDLSHLSFDERMNYYKEKYESHASGSARGNARGNTPGEASRGKGRRQRGGAPNTGAANSDRSQRPPVTSVQQGPVQQTQSPPAEGDKKGILGRILGIFRKK